MHFHDAAHQWTFHHMEPHVDPPPCSRTWFSSANPETGDGSSLIQNSVCERNSSTNKIRSIRHIRSTCEARGYAVLGREKKQLSGTSVSQNVLYLAARANHTFSQIQQGVLWHLFTVQSTARLYHACYSNSKGLFSRQAPSSSATFIAWIILWLGPSLKRELRVKTVSFDCVNRPCKRRLQVQTLLARGGTRFVQCSCL